MYVCINVCMNVFCVFTSLPFPGLMYECMHLTQSNHWNALTDGKMKYIFNAEFGTEQLFNLTADPYELYDQSNSPSYTVCVPMCCVELSLFVIPDYDNQSNHEHHPALLY
jgi:hypothetical protein